MAIGLVMMRFYTKTFFVAFTRPLKSYPIEYAIASLDINRPARTSLVSLKRAPTPSAKADFFIILDCSRS